MGYALMSEPNDSAELLRRAAAGDEGALTQVLDPQRQRLKRLIRLRLNRLLQGRVDESDVVQEVLLEASQRLSDYIDAPAQPFYVWLRLLAGRKLIDLHRHHLGAEMRDVSLEVSPVAAHDTEATIAEARHLWKAIGRENAMIKIPGTPEGIRAFERATVDGINVNVTLLFAVEGYEQVAAAYLRALERRAALFRGHVPLPIGGAHQHACRTGGRFERKDPAHPGEVRVDRRLQFGISPCCTAIEADLDPQYAPVASRRHASRTSSSARRRSRA